MDQTKIVVKTNGHAIVAIAAITSFISFIAGVAITMYCEQESDRGWQLSEGTYIDSDMTADVLATVGINALKDKIYSPQEIEEMLRKAEVI